jgi:hypothetical protein
MSYAPPGPAQSIAIPFAMKDLHSAMEWAAQQGPMPVRAQIENDHDEFPELLSVNVYSFGMTQEAPWRLYCVPGEIVMDSMGDTRRRTFPTMEDALSAITADLAADLEEWRSL